MRKFLIAIVVLQSTVVAIAQQTYPRNDIAFSPNDCYAFTNATVVKNAQTILQNATVVIRKGKIASVGTDAAPKDALVIDCKGKYIYPSFIDLYSDYGMVAQQNQGRGFNFGGPSQMLSSTKGAYAWNMAVKAEADASKVFTVNETKAKDLRGNGFGVVLTHVNDGIVRGNGTLVTLANEKENKVMLKEKASAHYSFNKGSSTQDYPNSLMGSIALLRQTYLDAQWYKTKPVEEGTNITLQAFNELQGIPQIMEAGDKWQDLRAVKIAKEFNTNYIVVGGNNEYQRIADIKNTGASFIMPIALPQASDVEDPNDARFTALSEMKHWEMANGNLAQFEKNNINFAITTYGLRESNTFMTNLRKAITAGLSESKALEALTKIPATLLGVDNQVGTLDAGKWANLLITSGPIFKEKTIIFQNWIQGKPYILKEEGFTDYRANYNFKMGNENYTLELSGDAAKPTAKLLGKDTTKIDLKLNDNLVGLSFALKKDSSKVTRLSGVNMGTSWQGNGQLANGAWVKWSADKVKDFVEKIDSAKKDMAKKQEAIGNITYPFNGFGWKEKPTTENILFKNATVWTNEKEGKLENTDVHINNGKIVAVGKNLNVSGAKTIDATGKHITAGIIDEHSHIAAVAINECSQSVTAEVRMGDVINPEDINIYRQLSGGVTAVHILHGSCNTIGGQTQLIKLRWGANAEDMKYAGWDGFIKFALGENVKRSSSQQNNRYPDTRMGVEQLLEDAFTRARDYEKMGNNKRRDLELDALVEILNSKRFITCHSYVQSEIVALMRVAEKFNFKVNTFTHILEGYKVADKMKAHGAAASTFSDWWAYKMEVIDAIPQNPYLMQKVGLNVAINSDDNEMARRLNQEAAKSVKYAGMEEQDALKMVTLNPATMLHIADKTGSIKVGKDADIVLWNTHPLSIYAKAEKTLVDGIVYFDREKDILQQEVVAKERNRLIQKMIGAKKGGEKVGLATPSFMEEAFCELDHTHGKSLWERLEKRMQQTQSTTSVEEGTK
jgi:imidazolonepropionase-like amidohydrolase